MIFFFSLQTDKDKNVSFTCPFTGFPYVYLENNFFKEKMLYYYIFNLLVSEKNSKNITFNKQTRAIQQKRITLKIHLSYNLKKKKAQVSHISTVIPAVRKLRQDKFKAGLGYFSTLRLCKHKTERKTLRTRNVLGKW